jgi:hypothetical protein
MIGQPTEPPFKERLVTIQRPDGTTYQASFGGKIWRCIGANGEDLPMVGRLTRYGKWSHGVLHEGEQIVDEEPMTSIHRKCASSATGVAADMERKYDRQNSNE